jgi:O-antigen/teichoic acid export membrane protein
LGDVVWMQKIYRKVTLYSLLSYGAVFLLLAIFGRKLFALWVGDRSAPSTLLICAVGLNYWLILWTNNHGLLLNAFGVLKKQVIIMSLHAIVAVSLNIYLVQKLGTIGLAVGGSLAYLSISAWYLPRLFGTELSKIQNGSGRANVSEQPTTAIS